MVNICLPKEGIKRRDKNETKERPKPIKANIKSQSSMFSTQGKLWWDINSKGLGQPCHNVIAGCSPNGFSLGLVLLTACGFSQMFHIPNISTFLGSPLSQFYTLLCQDAYYLTFQVFFWIWIEFSLPVKPALWEWSKILPSAWAVARTPWITAAEAAESLNIWELWTECHGINSLKGARKEDNLSLSVVYFYNYSLSLHQWK